MVHPVSRDGLRERSSVERTGQGDQQFPEDPQSAWARAEFALSRIGPMKLVAAKHNCVEAAKKVVDLAMTVSGGAGMFKSSELERLYRDVRCGGFHPANTLLVHEIVGKSILGIDLGEQPRWG
jgi:alkylation response protein AidB-like acyl-CoA dehydrogenase